MQARQDGRGLVKRSLSLSGHRTSVALEAEFWMALEALAAAQGVTLVALVASEDAARDPARTLASALRVRALQAGTRAAER
ncbi:ribbon-helix-helix domain-containing protein [Lichenicola sp.]|uniref:ribbon-helix-helix domain-containing protein n=1 Tax=Lichenicola sp. TaxID=2804529 RepID=UPI003AFFFE36